MDWESWESCSNTPVLNFRLVNRYIDNKWQYHDWVWQENLLFPSKDRGEVFHFSNTLLFKWYYYTGSGTLFKTVVFLHMVSIVFQILVEIAFYGHDGNIFIKQASFAVALNSELYLNQLSVYCMQHYIFRLLFYLSVQTLSMHVFALCSTLKKILRCERKNPAFMACIILYAINPTMQCASLFQMEWRFWMQSWCSSRISICFHHSSY